MLASRSTVHLLLLTWFPFFTLIFSAPAPPIVPELAEAVSQPVIRAYRNADHWLVRPESLPSLDMLPSSPTAASVLERVRSFGRSPARTVVTPDGNVKMINEGSSPRLFRFGTKDRIYIVQPGTRETIQADELTHQQYHALTVSRIPKHTPIVYDDVSGGRFAK
ncbi:hypothetical protein PHSY_006725 [Pseudozyma hubeiensis SY62]|uniref:Uncharacterized protein n=1 Tax=Pseudozyma hubeiensis (strain SY62) TaxID=1305764 RepID=R9PCZ9_PSEHS|nr:hypothetical protein PHSY_006725 [Pseudozyma hubeiensis SY62]GAC99127.1 hypothetical protein PHSY_006725 [Pseudozyma hubeiensis SY62]